MKNTFGCRKSWYNSTQNPPKPSEGEGFQVSRTFLSEDIPRRQEGEGGGGPKVIIMPITLTLTQNHYPDQNHNLNPEL